MYVCATCHATSAVKLGKCPECGSYGTFMKDPSKIKSGSGHRKSSGQVITKKTSQSSHRYTIEQKELKRTLPKGIKSGGLYLLGGAPGIGKSTLTLQLIHEIISHNQDIRIAYFSGEEDGSQIYDRRLRLFPDVDTGQIFDKFLTLFHSTHIEDILSTTGEYSFDMIVIDSIQTVYSTGHDSVAGSPSQVKQCSEKISERCKSHATSCLLIGHVTKGGEIAGPKYLEHIVDVVMYLEGERGGAYRFLRTKKNRFGTSDEVGVYEMNQTGLQPVYDLHKRLMDQVGPSAPGQALSIGIDNGRAFLVQIEVLTSPAQGKYPQRISQGIDTKRLQLIIAILERYLKLKLGFVDIYVNIPGEFIFKDTGLDLALAAAIYAQMKNITIDQRLIYIGELGLSGKVITPKRHSKRVKEAQSMHVIDATSLSHISQLPGTL